MKNINTKPRKHMVIPDCQVTPDTPTDHLRWIGEYMVEKKPDIVVCLGDFADMESLCSYDYGKKSHEGRRYKKDIDAAKNAMSILMKPLNDYNKMRVKNKKRKYSPDLHLTIGNHEFRTIRAVESDPKLYGFMSIDDLGYESFGWKVHDFLKVFEADGVNYAHYFANPLSGRPYGGENIGIRLKNIGLSFVMGHQQIYMLGVKSLSNGKRIRGLVQGSCLTPDHKILTADLRYIPLGDVKAGDKVVSFDEHTGNKRDRRYKTGTVQNVKIEKDIVYKVTLSNGDVFKTTKDHLWLTRCGGYYKWTQTCDLYDKNCKTLAGAGGRHQTRITKLQDVWSDNLSYNAGYLSGMYDGEGSLYARKLKEHSIMQLNISQKPGLVWNKTVKAINEQVGVNMLSSLNQRGVNTGRLKGGISGIVKFLGEIRPVRLLNKFFPESMGCIRAPRINDTLVESVKKIGSMDIVRIDIDEKTMIIDGYGHHNCYIHDEDYRGPQSNNEWRGIFILHEVIDGDYSLMEVSLDFLCRKYEKMPVWEYMEIHDNKLFKESTWMQRQKKMSMK